MRKNVIRNQREAVRESRDRVKRKNSEKIMKENKIIWV